MTWTERLNRLEGRVALGGGAGIEVLHWAYDPDLADNVPHRHAYHEVCLVGGWGVGRFTVEGEDHAIGPGDLFFARPGVVHQIRNDQSRRMELSWVSFTLTPGSDDARLRRFAESAVAVASAGSVASVWSALRNASEQRASTAELQALVVALLLGILRTGADSDARSVAGDAAVQQAVRFIHDQLHRPLTVPEIATAAGVSPRQLTRLLARFTGVSPAAYVEKARIERASTLLLRTDDPIKMVAARAGYGDVHRFTRAFARVVGCPPGLFRRSGGAAGRRTTLTEETAGSLV